MDSHFTSMDDVPATLHTSSDLYTQGRRPAPGAEPAGTVKVRKTRAHLYTHDQSEALPGLDQHTLEKLRLRLHCTHCGNIHRNRFGKALLPEYTGTACRS